MLEAASKAFFHMLAGSQTLKKLASRYGMRNSNSFARRFIAGESVEEAIHAARALQIRGLKSTLDLLGESVTSIEEADAATRAYITVIHAILESGIDRNLSLKLTQLGLDVDQATCVDNLRRLLDVGEPHGFFVRIDMESSVHVAATLDVFETIWGQGYRKVGVVIQAALHRSENDLRRINSLGATVRLVKGAYREPKSVAYQDKKDVDRSFIDLTRLLLAEGTHPAIATHDPTMLDVTKAIAAELNRPKDEYEFQMLFGIRRDLQSALVAEGFQVRIYIPFGREWFPYFMRRLGERPANVAFVIGSLLKEH